MLQVPELASAAGYFFKEGVEGKKLCPTVNYYAPMLYKMFVSFSGSGLSFFFGCKFNFASMRFTNSMHAGHIVNGNSFECVYTWIIS